MTNTSNSNPNAEETKHDEPSGDTDPTGPTDSPLAGYSKDTGLPLESIFDILRNERRQHVLAYLALDDDDTVRIGDLAEHIAAIENDKQISALTSQQRKRVYVALYQCHLPKMASADVVAFDKDRGTVTVGPNLDQLRPYLDVEPDHSDATSSPPIAYVVLATAGIVAYLAAALLGTNGAVTGGVVLLVGLVAFTAILYGN